MAKPKKRKRNFESIYEEEDDFTSPGIQIHTNPKIPKLEPILDKGERRNTPRFRIEFEAVIFCKGISFRTKTINVSLTGALLTENIPINFVDQPLDIVMIRHIGRAREYYLLRGKSLNPRFRTPRIQFTKIQESQKKKLEALFSGAERSYGDKK